MKDTRRSDKERRQQLAADFVVSANDSNLQKMRQLAELLEDRDWAVFRSLRLKGSGLPLGWARCIALVSAGDGKTLLKTAKLAAKRDWSCERIRQHLQRATGGKSRRPGTGRKMRMPATLEEGLQQLLADLDVVKKRLEVLSTKFPVAEGIGGKLKALTKVIKMAAVSNAVKNN